MSLLILHAASRIGQVVSEQMMAGSGEVRVEIPCGKDPRTCEHVAQQTTWVSDSRFRFERLLGLA